MALQLSLAEKPDAQTSQPLLYPENPLATRSTAFAAFILKQSQAAPAIALVNK
jgi:hypothetical protein